jgi:hypothetical protein
MGAVTIRRKRAAEGSGNEEGQGAQRRRSAGSPGSAGQPLGSTARSREHIRQQVEVAGGQRFVVLLRGGEECDAVQALMEAGYGRTRMEVVRKALVKAAAALKKGKR